MPIKIVREEDRDYVHVFCDWCDKRIERAAQGNYQWVMWENGRVADRADIFYTHKWCCWSFEKHNGGRGPESVRHFGAVGLECLPIYLSGNLELNWVDAMRSSRFMAGFDPDLVTPRLDREEWRRVRKAVFERDKYRCQYCGEKAVRLECDHVIPISIGGSNGMDNLVTACYDCNRSKRAKPVQEWIAQTERG